MRSPSRALLAALAGGLLVSPGAARADDVGRDQVVVVPDVPGLEGIDDPVIRDMLALDAIAPFEDLAPLWDWEDHELQGRVDAALARLGLDDDARKRRLAIALVDVTDPRRPRVATVNGAYMRVVKLLSTFAVLRPITLR